MALVIDIDTIKKQAASLPGKGLPLHIAQFLLLRTSIDEIEEAVKKELKPLRDIKEALAGCFDKFLTETGQQSAVTSAGTVHWNTRYTASLSDPQAFMNFVLENKYFELLERRASVAGVEEFIEKEHAVPPGVNLNRIRTIGANKPGEKAKEK